MGNYVKAACISAAIALAAAAAVMIFSSSKETDINSGVERYRNTPGAVLVDVRTAEEYSEGHIRGSVNVPLQRIQDISLIASDKNTPLFVYCRSGRRSAEAADWLKTAGYENVYNIGGILDYRGDLVH